MSQEILKELSDKLVELDGEGCAAVAQEAVSAGLDPMEAIGVLTDTIHTIGEKFHKGDLFLPDLIGAGAAMEAAMIVLNKELLVKGLERESLGTVVIGTVRGDVHSIGKDIVRTMLTAGGFVVHDLGVDNSAEKFIAAVREHNPNIIAMSALLTTTVKEQEVVIDNLKEAGLRESVKVMVGGGALDQAFAEKIGADGYGSTAAEAVMLAKELVAN